MGLKTNYHNFEQVSTVLPTDVFVQEFPEMFSGKLGNLLGKKVHLIVNHDVDPVIRTARTILKADLRAKLDELVCTERERNGLFNDALNTFYLRLYGVIHMVKDHSDSEKGNPLPPDRLLLSINSKGSFICSIP